MQNIPESPQPHSTAGRNLPFELLIGWRYTRAKRSNHFISFISMTSMIGIALGVAALIVVLSVMNGFQEELRQRILGVAAHVQITGDNNQLAEWRSLEARLQNSPHVLASAPYIMAQGMLANGQAVQGVIVRGILPALEPKVSELADKMRAGKLQDLKPGEFGIILGQDLAHALGAVLGDKIVLMAPQGQFTPTGVVPRIKQFRLIGIFQVGMYEYDAGLALIHMADAAKLYRMGENVSGMRLKLDDLFLAPEISRALANTLSYSGNFYVSNWTEEHANFFRAVQMEKRVMFIILTLIVAVAAFNIVSTLVMAVTDKRADIAILRTLGASPKSIMAIFVVQGATVGVLGTLGGLLLGLSVAFNIDVIVPAIENLLGASFLPRDIYLISRMPSDPQAGDIWPIAIISLVLAFLATIYPSWRASRVNPAQALRYE
jgi:lipoprotein-releasing system permease protein